MGVRQSDLAARIDVRQSTLPRILNKPVSRKEPAYHKVVAILANISESTSEFPIIQNASGILVRHIEDLAV